MSVMQAEKRDDQMATLLGPNASSLRSCPICSPIVSRTSASASAPISAMDRFLMGWPADPCHRRSRERRAELAQIRRGRGAVADGRCPARVIAQARLVDRRGNSAGNGERCPGPLTAPRSQLRDVIRRARTCCTGQRRNPHRRQAARRRRQERTAWPYLAARAPAPGRPRCKRRRPGSASGCCVAVRRRSRSRRGCRRSRSSACSV
jgi:hypothetical protein